MQSSEPAHEPSTGPGDGAAIDPVTAPIVGLPVTSGARSRLPLIAAAVVTVLLIGTTTLWLVNRSQVADLNAQVTQLQAESSVLQGKVESDQAREEARVAAENDVPNLKAVADKYFTNITGDQDSVRLKLVGSSMIELGPTLIDMLDELGFSSAVIDRMESTRALDGTLTADGHNCNVSWTYHPDSGLTMVFETDR